MPVASTVPNQFLTKKLLWNWYKKTSKGRPKGGEKREKGYYTEIFPLTRSEDPCAFYTSPICTGNPCFLVSWCSSTSYGIMEWVMEGDMLKAWGWMDPEGSFAWSLQKVTQVILLLLYILFFYNKETRLGSRYASSLCLWFSCLNFMSIDREQKSSETV